MLEIGDTWMHYLTRQLSPELAEENNQKSRDALHEAEDMWATIMTNEQKGAVW
jgi:hypothetical protein